MLSQVSQFRRNERPWPYRPTLLPDELLSSYIVRIAEGLDIMPIRLLNTAWGSHRNLLAQDLDNFVPERVVLGLVANVGCSRDAVLGATLGSYSGTLFTHHNPRGRNPWLLPTTVDNNRRRRPGLQFCPQCLIEDPRPYFRKRWRLAFVTSCSQHGSLLRDRCPSCAAPVHQHAMRSRTTCGACTPPICVPTARASSQGHLRWQAQLEAGLSSGWIRLGEDFLRSHVVFAIVRQVAALLLSGKRAEDFRREAARAWGGDPAPFARPTARQPVEYLDVAERHRLFELTFCLLQGWPFRFVHACSEAGIHRSHAIKDMSDPPYAFESILTTYLDSRPYRPGEEEVAAAADWLRKTRGRATYRDLKAIVGESRSVIYRHMDYERVQSRPSRWRSEVEPLR